MRRDPCPQKRHQTGGHKIETVSERLVKKMRAEAAANGIQKFFNVEKK